MIHTVFPSFMNSPGLILKSKSLNQKKAFLSTLASMKGRPSQSIINPSHMGLVPE